MNDKKEEIKETIENRKEEIKNEIETTKDKLQDKIQNLKHTIYSKSNIICAVIVVLCFCWILYSINRTKPVNSDGVDAALCRAMIAEVLSGLVSPSATSVAPKEDCV